ncbi:hypothetical protein ACKKBF_B41035 [Auxenochlorella protothecoides x Auxenochlorella symbiontica]
MLRPCVVKKADIGWVSTSIANCSGKLSGMDGLRREHGHASTVLYAAVCEALASNTELQGHQRKCKIWPCMS